MSKVDIVKVIELSKEINILRGKIKIRLEEVTAICGELKECEKGLCNMYEQIIGEYFTEE